jgi:hypothetical protein
MKKNSLTIIISAAILLLSSLMLMQMPGCGGGSGGSSTSVGTLQASITDSPVHPNFDSIHLTIDKVVLVPAGKEGLADNDPGLPVIATFPSGLGVDILNLHFVPQVLGTLRIPAGRYSQVRLILAPDVPTVNNYVILTSNPTVRVPLKTPSAQQSGLKIVGNFTVTAGAFNSILLDFDPENAIVIAGNSGNVILKPTGIRIMQVFNSLTNAGSVFGTIRSPLFAPWSSATFSVAPRNPAASTVTAGVVFSNFSSPSVWKAPFSAFLPANGSAAVPSANYKVFVQAFRDTSSLVPTFGLYSSPVFTITTGVDTPVPPDGIVPLGP